MTETIDALFKPVYRVKAGQYAFDDAADGFESAPRKDMQMGGGLEGANRMSRETATWRASMSSPDALVGRAKPGADARGRDITYNDGYASGAVYVQKDSIVGAQYLLNADPNLAVLESGRGSGTRGTVFDDVWMDEYVEAVEETFNLLGESENGYLDAAGINTFTGQVRLAIGGFMWTGEVLATGEWIKDKRRPCATAVQMVSPSRLCNARNMPDTLTKRRGVTIDGYGRPQAYDIRDGYPTDPYNYHSYEWTTVQATKPWGRKQVLHIIEQREAGQNRGIADMVTALKHMRMTKTLSEVTLQNAVTQASYAAAIESELPPEAVAAMMGQNTGAENFMAGIHAYMTGLAGYIGEENGIKIDGVKIPHLYPGTKLNTKQLGTPGTLGQNFEASLLRHIAAALGLSYEEFSRDFSRVSYSSARASMNLTGRFMRARKKMVADRFATDVYTLWLEEFFSTGNIPLPRGISREFFYRPLMKEAFSSCSWTGSGVGQIDELKETQAALLRISGGLSTWRDEIARLGKDWRKQFKQIAKETKLQEKLGISFTMTAKKPTAPLSNDDEGDEKDPSGAEIDAGGPENGEQSGEDGED